CTQPCRYSCCSEGSAANATASTKAGVHGSVTVSTSTGVDNAAARRRPCCSPLAASSEPSVAIRMRSYMALSGVDTRGPLHTRRRTGATAQVAARVSERASLQRLQVGESQHQPLAAGLVEVHLHPRVGAAALVIGDHATAKAGMHHALAQLQRR